MKDLERFCKAKGLPRPGKLWGVGRVQYRMPDRVTVITGRQPHHPEREGDDGC